jgi:hypothetical protein
MAEKSADFPDDKTALERRKNLSKEEIKDLKLAGGVEGGMKAGSGGPESDEGAADRGGDERSEAAKSGKD